MHMAKLKAPEGMTDFSIAGEEYEVEADGSIEVPVTAVDQLVGGHGFTTWTVPEAKSQKGAKSGGGGENGGKDGPPPTGTP